MSEKNLKYYLNAEYEIRLVYDFVDKIWIISFPELKGCMAHGDSIDEAMMEGMTAKEGWIQVSFEAKHNIPEPKGYDR